MSGIVTYEGDFKFGEGNVYLTVSFSVCTLGQKVEIMNLNVAHSKTPWGDECPLISTDSKLNDWLEFANNPILSDYPNYTAKDLVIFLVAISCAVFHAQKNCSDILPLGSIEYKVSSAAAKLVADSLEAAGFTKKASDKDLNASSMLLFTRTHDELPMNLAGIEAAAEIIEQLE